MSLKNFPLPPAEAVPETCVSLLVTELEMVPSLMHWELCGRVVKDQHFLIPWTLFSGWAASPCHLS